MTSVLIRGEETPGRTRSRYVKMEAGTGAMRPRPTERRGWPVTPRRWKSRKEAPTEPSEAHSLARTLIFDFRPPELGEDKFLLFYATKPAAVC